MTVWDDNDGLEVWERPGFHDAMADRADRDLDEMKLDGTYTAWVAAGRPVRAEWNRRQLEDEAEGLNREATDVARESGEDAPSRPGGPTESMDDYMERTKDSGYPASIRRMAWVTGEPAEKVWQHFQSAREFQEGNRDGD